jgi:hypothetical protein
MCSIQGKTHRTERTDWETLPTDASLDVELWEQDWDDDNLDDEFSIQLR